MLVKNCAEMSFLMPSQPQQPLLLPGTTSLTPHRIKMQSQPQPELLLQQPNLVEEEEEEKEQQQPLRLDCTRRTYEPNRQRKHPALSARPVTATAAFLAGKKSLPAQVNHKLTEYFPVRRSVRKCKKVVLEEKQRDLENKVRCGIEDGLQVRNFLGKGRGVVTTRAFTKGEFVVEYDGELIDMVTAKKRETKYAKDQNTGCYMYYFQHRNQHYCVDATAESDRLGRLVNHSRNGNLTTRVVEVGSTPHLVLIAKEDIPAGVEVTYDYGDRSRESIRNHPWLAN